MTEWHPTNRFADPPPEGPLPGSLRMTGDKAELYARYHARIAEVQMLLSHQIRAIQEEGMHRYDVYRADACPTEIAQRMATYDVKFAITQVRRRAADTMANLRDQLARDVQLLDREQRSWMQGFGEYDE